MVPARGVSRGAEEVLRRFTRGGNSKRGLADFVADGYPHRMDAREALVALNMVEHVGPIRVRQLLEHFGDAPSILRASRQRLVQVRGIGDDTAEAIANWEKNIDLG